MESPIDGVAAFNHAINSRDIDTLSALMTDDHRFVDSAGNVVAGRAACIDAWRQFFEAFPDYRNIFEEVDAPMAALVLARGRSECSVPELDGPARWSAIVVGDRLAQWRVEVDLV